MNPIPVIDLLDGQVVRAQRGERERYRPIDSALCRSSSPLAVARALLGLYPFSTLYIADLDAIQQRGNHFPTIAAIRETYPDIELWLDAGFANTDTCSHWQELDVTFVVGSESLNSIEELRRMRAALGDEKLVLSLDWRDEVSLGPAALFASASDWPSRVIAMTLERVGNYSGPDTERLQQLRGISDDTAIHAAGGLRDAHDLHILKSMGIAGALLASALHDGKINEKSLLTLASKNEIAK